MSLCINVPLIITLVIQKAQLGRVIEESPLVHAQSTVQLSELDDIRFQRSASLPRGFGGQRPHPVVHNGPVVPPPRSDSMTALKNMMMARRLRIKVFLIELIVWKLNTVKILT